MELDSFERLIPCNISAIKHCLEAPKSHKCIVIYESPGGILFVLNPFGGGTCATQELKLADDFEITEDKLDRIYILRRKDE